MRFYKNLIAAYLCFLFCFSYTTLLAAIPNHIYLAEGEDPEFHLSVPVSSAASESIMVFRFLGVFPIKEVEVSVISPQSVYASGRVIGIYEQTSGVLVLKTDSISDASGVAVSPSENRVLSGDYICGVNGAAVTTKEELIDAVQENGENRLTLTLVRKGGQIDVAVDPVCSADGQYMLGIWVKDDMAGIGTMTYYTTSGSFGALGHGIGDGETGNLLAVSSGSIFNMRLMGIEKGQTGTPGELKGIIYYGSDNYLGSVDENDEMGIYGTLGEACLQEYRLEDDCFEIGYMQEIETGSAYILSDISGEVKSYEIAIDSVNYQAADTNKGILFHVMDSDLLDLTGGIVQGMSGSPIIQNGRLIGAVTHVLVNDPAKGYGIFIETMLEHDQD
jgi:stage IV sporulation protein B